uniref:RuvC-like Holliday junction resolvase n=1 Tax=Salmonella phage vB_SEnST11_KE23 TaxID=3161174 RepID=A0AAU8GIT7_9CAUD
MKLMSVDQSLSHCAVVIWEHGVPVYREMIRTGSTSSKGKRNKDVVYFDTVYEQIRYIVGRIITLADQYRVNCYVMEALSLGSIGSATRDLAGLFHCIVYALYQFGILGYCAIHTVAPTSVKSFARTLLPKEEQFVVKEKVDKKSGKKVYSTGPVKMEKSHMVRAVDCDMPGWLDGLTLAAGKADYADAYLIGKKFLEGLSAEKE